MVVGRFPIKLNQQLGILNERITTFSLKGKTLGIERQLNVRMN